MWHVGRDECAIFRTPIPRYTEPEPYKRVARELNPGLRSRVAGQLQNSCRQSTAARLFRAVNTHNRNPTWEAGGSRGNGCMWECAGIEPAFTPDRICICGTQVPISFPATSHFSLLNCGWRESNPPFTPCASPDQAHFIAYAEGLSFNPVPHTYNTTSRPILKVPILMFATSVQSHTASSVPADGLKPSQPWGVVVPSTIADEN